MEQVVLHRLLVKHVQFPGLLSTLLAGVDGDEWRARPDPDGWSLLEILVHMRDEEIEDFRLRAQAAAAGRPIDHPIDPQGWVTQRDYNTQDPVAILRSFTDERGVSCRWLAGLDPGSLARSIDDPNLGTIRCGDFVAAWRMHDLLHLRQLTTTLARLEARRLEGWRLGYAGRIP